MSDLLPRHLVTNRSGLLQIVPEPIAHGGEGSIHAIAGRPGVLAKLYFQQPDAARATKLTAMVRLGSDTLASAAAWPSDLILETTSDGPRVAGFLMPEVKGHREIHQLFSPVERKRHFPQANWKMLALAASNLGRVVAAVHASGSVIGDLNQNNVLVSPRATVYLIDCDSFQFRIDDSTYWTCDVGKEEYLPPELQSANLRGMEREPRHDDFALAVLVFQLLFMGRHPFAGRHGRSGDFGIGAAIADGAYFYGREAHQKGLAPPPGVISADDLSDPLAEAFEQAFLSHERPTAARWSELMLDFAESLVACPASPRHSFHPRSGECPWCRLKSSLRVDFFPDIIDSTVSGNRPAQPVEFQVDPAVLIDRIQAIPPFEVKYVRPKISKKRLRSPEPIPAGFERPNPFELVPEPQEPDPGSTGSLAILMNSLAWPTFAAAVVAMFVQPKFSIPAAVAGFAMIGISKWSARNFRSRSLVEWLDECEEVRANNEADHVEWLHSNHDWLAECDRRNRIRDIALAALAEKESAWMTWLEKAREKDTQLRAEAKSMHSRLTDALAGYRRELAEQSTARRAYAIEAWLESHLIRDASIPQIGRTRVTMLASFGIETAADVVRLVQNQSYAIPGFGQRLLNNLWYWAADVQSRFDPAGIEHLPLAATLQIKARYEPEVHAAEHRLDRIARELAAISPAVESQAPAVMERLAELTKDYLEADRDARLMAQ
jgi:DNA-binding helix-hairpin-helix protein with protein kinase domain